MNDKINDLIQVLKKNSSSRACNSLDLINQVCEQIFNTESKNYTINNVAKISSSLGGPASGAIRNTSGNKYRILINAWKSEVARKNIKKEKKYTTDIPNWIDEIYETSLKTMVLDLYFEKKKLLSEIASLRQHLKPVVIDMRATSSNYTTNPYKTTFTESEIIALKHAISDDMISSRGWRSDLRGQILDQNNRTVFKSGFLVAVKKIITHSCDD